LENNEVITLSMAERSFSSSPNDLRLFLDSILHQASAHRFQEFAKLSALLSSRSSTQRQSLSCVCSAFSRMVNIRKATVTSMPHGPDSFLIVCSTCSNGRLGRSR
jgi:hypothetical protein